MRTIQEYLKEADMDRLVTEFFNTHPAQYELEDRMDLSVRQIRENKENHLVEYIHRLQSMEIGPDEEMPTITESAKLIQMIRGAEEVEKMDTLLSLALTGGDYNWI
jgi:hypothetical protein